MFSSSLISEADSKREIYVLRSGCVTRTKVTIFKGRTHLEAQILLCVFKRKFSLSVILKEPHLPFTISTNTHTYVHHGCLEARSLSFCRKNNCSDFLTDFSKKKCVLCTHIHSQKKKHDNQVLAKHLTACSIIKGITQRQIYIQMCAQTPSRTRDKGTRKYYRNRTIERHYILHLDLLLC